MVLSPFPPLPPVKMSPTRTIHVQYFAILREQRGLVGKRDAGVHVQHVRAGGDLSKLSAPPEGIVVTEPGSTPKPDAEPAADEPKDE